MPEVSGKFGGDDDLAVVWKRRKGGGLLMLVGLPFLSIGLYAMAGSLGLGPEMKYDQGHGAPWFVGLLFATVGAGVMFGRAGVEINRQLGTVKTWWGLLVPFSQQEHQLKDYKKIRITREQRRSKNRSYTVYPVKLAGGPRPISIGEQRRYEDARRLAEDLARFCRLAVADQSHGAEVIRSHDELDESLRDRAYRLSQDFEVPDLPPAMQSRVHYGETEVTIEIPASGSSVWKLLALAPGTVVMLLVMFVFLRPLLRNADMPAKMRFVLTAFLGGVFVVLPLLRMARGLAVSLRPQRVIASPDRITLKTPGLFLSREVSISADDLEDLSLPQRDSTPDLETETAPAVARALAHLAPHSQFAITARSDRQTIIFGEGMPEEELRWTYLMVKKMLTM